jgi:hypothetical protein
MTRISISWPKGKVTATLEDTPNGATGSASVALRIVGEYLGRRGLGSGRNLK